MEKENKYTITLDKERTLAFPVMALVKLKKELGIQLSDLKDKEKSQDIEVVLGIIWAGLIHEDRDLTVEDVGYMVDLSDLPEISNKLSEIFKGINAKKKPTE